MTASTYFFWSLVLINFSCLGQAVPGHVASEEANQSKPSVKIGGKTLYIVQGDSTLFESQVKRGEIFVSGGSRGVIGSLLPSFSLSDQNGKKWNASMLAGRKTVAGIWASWCVSCREDLRILQSLNDSLPPKSDLQIVTFNIDEDVMMAKRFISENKLTLPALLESHSYISEFLGTTQVAIPRHWTISNSGRLSEETIGAIRDEKTWIDSLANQASKGFAGKP